MHKGKITQIGQFLFERQGKFKPDALELDGLKRIDKIDFSGNFHIAQKPSNTNMILIKPGDLVISGINVAKGALAIYQGHEDVTATIHYSSYTFDETQIEVEYFKRFLKSPEFVRLLKEQVKGGIKTEIKPKHLLALEIPLPSLKEQKSIVAHFLRFELEQGELNFEITHQKNLLNKLRRQILQESIEGKLTESWRVQNLDVESAHHLFGCITNKRQQIFEASTARKSNLLPLLTKSKGSFTLPEKWQWVSLGDLVSPAIGITYGIVKMGSEPKSGGVCALRCSDVRFRKIDLTGARRVTDGISNQFKRTVLRGGEILLNIRGTLGGCAIVDKNLKGFNIAREVGLIPLVDESLNGFMLNVLTSPYFESEINRNLRGIAYKGLNLNILNTLLVPLPPIKEQQEINAKVEGLLGLCDQLEAEIDTNQSHAKQLMHAVLKEAFSQSDIVFSESKAKAT